jgi:hypothetical protein
MVGRTLNDLSTMRGFPRRIIWVGNPFEPTFHLIEPGTLIGLDGSGIVFSVAGDYAPATLSSGAYLRSFRLLTGFGGSGLPDCL